MRNNDKNLVVCDIYFSRIPTSLRMGELFPKERAQEVASVTNEQVKKSKYWAWKTLEYALFKTFGWQIRDLEFSKTQTGKWVCEQCFLSISHTKDFVAVAVSNQQTGIDVEERSNFFKKTADPKVFARLAKKITSETDEQPKEPMDLLKLWTRKECAFKVVGEGAFVPSKIQIDENIKTLRVENGDDCFIVSVYGKDVSSFRFYAFDGETALEYADIEWI